MKVEIVNQQKLYPIDRKKIRRIINTILKDEKKDAELSVVFLDNKRIKEINKIFLHHDDVTDVLSFAYSEPFLKDAGVQQRRRETTLRLPLSEEVEKRNMMCSGRDEERKFLSAETVTGEIIVSVEMAVQIAKKQGYSIEGEIILYVIHGLLHLIGYDDKRKREAKKMHQREKELLLYFGYTTIPVPN
ncbi:MAG: rRNA maturation RNase YbeY [wastewater metagenome]|nr:rRNA maturation RNase YbeY [Candidatus Loosdrechtia aerotolerans]